MPILRLLGIRGPHRIFQILSHEFLPRPEHLLDSVPLPVLINPEWRRQHDGRNQNHNRVERY